ncbi:MarR family winged helix-turn-helix transcriptional regulator [Caviibacterium pharyngocola]|uniref:MarR family transcriptional regulator n=1 Tax=Caviibacterium pharyngocola TaxID=28159 RepID=A0A2M8RTR1_9PAST|nr:MarR family winged helix-turn-helix transcriptional regulator [Caviibacterium pharyngocola]PJG82276.1 MarR family transcriptional regulator [Caviibacterium pharyngocola]
MDTKSQATQADQFGQLFSAIAHYYQTWARKQGINYNQLAVLHSLSRHSQRTQKQICDEWALPKQTISTICKQYLADGILSYTETEDKREKLLSLTEQGRAFAKPIVQGLDEIENHVFTQFGKERSENLLREFIEISRLFREQMGE